ncbi:hypothetical protein [Pulveribacter sp.]|uniref:hypothetical protein n=1 Tax=Pulveribacter sp. TaxID=2678893 RepID=UPI002897D75B|nr:hypothetical protein [Pulveribacter sp.]
MSKKYSKLLITAVALATFFAMSYAADVVVQPSAGSALVVTDNAGGSPRFRVQEDGKISIPGWQSLPPQSGQMCIDLTLGFIGPCSSTVGFSLPFAATVASNGALLDLTQGGGGNVIDVTLPNSSGARGVSVQHNGVGPGIYANTVGGNSIWGVTGSVSAAAVIGDSSSGEAIVGRQNGAICNKNIGKCHGIGAVVGRHDGEGGYGVRGFVTSPNGSIGVLGQAGISGGSGVAGRFENVNSASTRNALQVATNGSGAAASITGGTNTQDLVVLVSESTNVARIDKYGKGFFNGGTQTGGADIAEVIDTTGRLPEPGDVVEIDPHHPLRYRLTSASESILVAGVVTTKPGVLMNAGVEDAAGRPAVALAGRVPVRVTTEGGTIRAGDLLVSADTIGHAMKAPVQLIPGTVIGKALQNFLENEPGVIEMLVMLR